MLYRQRNTRNGGGDKLRQQQVYSIVYLPVYWPPVSVHCYRLFGEENAQVTGRGVEHRGKAGVGDPGRGWRDEEQTDRKQLMGQS